MRAFAGPFPHEKRKCTGRSGAKPQQGSVAIDRADGATAAGDGAQDAVEVGIGAQLGEHNRFLGSEAVVRNQLVTRSGAERASGKGALLTRGHAERPSTSAWTLLRAP